MREDFSLQRGDAVDAKSYGEGGKCGQCRILRELRGVREAQNLQNLSGRGPDGMLVDVGARVARASFGRGWRSYQPEKRMHTRIT